VWSLAGSHDFTLDAAMPMLIPDCLIIHHIATMNDLTNQNHKSIQNLHFGLGFQITSQTLARTCISDFESKSQVDPEPAFQTWIPNHKSNFGQNLHFGL
jgi:cytochrome b561